MGENFLGRLYEHNNWANEQILDACAGLSDEQLDAPPPTVTVGTIRETLIHIAKAQWGYLKLLTLPLEERNAPTEVMYADVPQTLRSTGENLLALTHDLSGLHTETKIQTRDGYFVEPWVLLTQIINHATEHREQIKSMLTALGIEPPSIDGWDYGEVKGALVEIRD